MSHDVDAEIARRNASLIGSPRPERATSTPLPLPRIPAPYAGNLSLSLAYCVGRRARRLGEHLNPYPGWTEQAKAWDAGREAQ